MCGCEGRIFNIYFIKDSQRAVSLSSTICLSFPTVLYRPLPPLPAPNALIYERWLCDHPQDQNLIIYRFFDEAVTNNTLRETSMDVRLRVDSSALQTGHMGAVSVESVGTTALVESRVCFHSYEHIGLNVALINASDSYQRLCVWQKKRECLISIGITISTKRV